MLALESIRLHRAREFALHVEALRVAEGERVTLIGPSGSGKTTLLRLIGGLERGDAGRPARSADQNASHPTPLGETAPTPVTTTRRPWVGRGDAGTAMRPQSIRGGVPRLRARLRGGAGG